MARPSGRATAALGVPAEELLSPLARAGTLDYTSGPRGLFESLRSGFIAKILGLEPSTNAVADGSSSDDSILATPFASPPTVPTSGRPPRTVVEHPFDNDDFADAYPVSEIPFTGKTNTREAGREGDAEPDACEPAGGTVWYRYRPSNNLGLLANSFGSDHPIALGVFRGRDLNNLTLVDCDVHPSGNAQVVFSAKKGRSYYFQVAAPVSGGDLVFNLDPLGSTRMVSVAHDGKQSANGESKYAAVSADGRYVSFWSTGDNHVRRKETKTCFWRNSETSDCPDVYVRDLARSTTELVSKSSRGVSSNGVSQGSAISGDGRYVVFHSTGANLVAHDDNDAGDIFVHDRRTHTTERVSISSNGREGTIPWAGNRVCKDDVPPTIPEFDQGFQELCKSPTVDFLSPGIGISSNGRYVVFASALHGLVKPEPPHCTDLTSYDYLGGLNHGPGVPVPADAGPYSCRHIYVHDRKTDETRLVSRSSEGEAGEGDSAGPFISRNGRWVVFSSSASNLVDNDTNGYRDVFVHDLRTVTTDLASISTWGQQGDAQSGGTNQRGHASISDDGRWVAFVSHASNLTEDDGTHTDDVFLRDRRSGQTILVSGPTGSFSVHTDVFGAGHSSISTDGRYVAFTTQVGEVSLGKQELFVWDRITQTITRISVATSGEECDGAFSHEPEISADGHYVVFESDCSNFDGRYRDPAEQAADFDVFIHELPWVR